MTRHPFGLASFPRRVPVGLLLGAALALQLSSAVLLSFAAKPGSAVAAEAGTKAPAGSAAAAAMPALFDRVEEFRLDNGMLFLLLPRADVPVVAGRVRFRVGNVDCPSGRSGVAHMFEHMAFQGTDRIGARDRAAELAVEDSIRTVGQALCHEVGLRDRADTTRIEALRARLDGLNERQFAATIPNEFSRLYDQHSYYFNAWTSADFTEYETDVPANALEIWMLMESERIQHPSFRGFYPERSVVIEERRQGEDNPSGHVWELLNGLAFQAHPYRLPVIGYMSDLEALSQQEAEAFRATYYVPGNAVCALVGDFDPAEAKRLIQAYFGDIPAGPAPPEIRTAEPRQEGMRRGVLRRGTDRELLLAFHISPPGTRDAVVQTLLADVLSRDITSRLDRRLDIEEKAASEVWAFADVGGRYPGLLVVHAKPLEGFTNEAVEQMIWEELQGVVTRPVTQAKLDEITASRRKRFYRGLTGNAALASFLVDGQMVHGDWRRPLELVREAATVTPQEVTEMAEALFRPDLATVVFVEPEKSANAAQGGEK